jgi:hypothetical protein
MRRANPRCLTANPIEPPIKPTPTMASVSIFIPFENLFRATKGL